MPLNRLEDSRRLFTSRRRARIVRRLAFLLVFVTTAGWLWLMASVIKSLMRELA